MQSREPRFSQGARQGRLEARPATFETPGATGLQPLAIDGNQIGLLYVPPDYRPEEPAPFALMCHGAGGDAQQGLGLLFHLADAHGLILAAVDSVGSTWDVIHSEYGSDASRIDAVLHTIFGRYQVDPTHLAVGGFSDGASYALSIGITNGDLFSHIIAFSPGFMVPSGQAGAPAIFISHGTHDRVLPIDRTSHQLVPRLREAGYAVEFLEFDGPHTVPPAATLAAMAWFVPRRLAGAA